jgi:hypothetical protein
VTTCIQTGAIVLTRVRGALVDVVLAARSFESDGAVAAEGARRVHARAAVLAGRVPRLLALVRVFGAVVARPPGGTRADVRAVDWRGVANGARVARVALARVVQVAP